jgi:hypothetical protein
MRCIFCRTNSSGSRSVEHVIPESLGNKRHVLRPGIVCDKCNNYFARKVEKPFLDLPSIRTLRFHQLIESKNGSVPPIVGAITPGFPARVTRLPRHDLTSILVSPRALTEIAQSKSAQLILPREIPIPVGQVTSRFMAKIALESMAARLAQFPEGLAYICNETQLDPLRDHARRGRIPQWPVKTRRIYDADAAVMGPHGALVQIVHESDFLVTPAGEWYFVLALFGLEFAINLGGPEISGYEQWLTEHNHASVLYSDRNAHFPIPNLHLRGTCSDSAAGGHISGGRLTHCYAASWRGISAWR